VSGLPKTSLNYEKSSQMIVRLVNPDKGGETHIVAGMAKFASLISIRQFHADITSN
jgi:hypothetical protein